MIKAQTTFSKCTVGLVGMSAGRLFAALGVLTLTSLLPNAAHAEDDTYSSIGTWNGKRVYLSPARHSDAGNRGECTTTAGMYNLDENSAAYRFAYYAATGNYVGPEISNSSGRNLRSRGYRVRVGRGTLNSAIANSNSWGAHAHIPIHSNAPSREGCSDTNASRHGTVVIYKSYGRNGGEGLAGFLRDTVGPASPGTNDLTCHNSSSCTSIDCLGELCQTNAKAAYLEREFHTWNRGAKWMRTDEFNSWRVGWAVDQFFDYP